MKVFCNKAQAVNIRMDRIGMHSAAWHGLKNITFLECTSMVVS